MSIPPRRILTEAERLAANKPARDDPFLDLIIYYLDRLLDHVVFSREIFIAIMMTLTPEGRRNMENELFTGCQDNDLEVAHDKDGRPEPASLGHAVMEAWNRWERRDRPSASSNEYMLDPTQVRKAAVEVFRSCHAGRDLADPCPVHREQLASIFGLTEPEVEILVLLWCATNEPVFKSVLDDLSLPGFQRLLADCAGVDSKTLKGLLAPKGRLLDMGFVLPDYMPPPHYTLGDEMRHFFNDPRTIFSFVVPLEEHIADAGTRQVALESFPVPAMSRGILEAILRGGKANVLIHGAPGTGKTTFVMSLLSGLGLRAFILSAVGGSEEERPPLLRLKVASHLARNAGVVLVVDESDRLINTQGRRSEDAATAKAWLTEFMDCHAGAIIWIANEVDEVHGAVKRRFAYSLEFKPQNERQRAVLWRELARGYGLDTAVGGDAIDSLSKAHAVNAGGIDIALRGLHCVFTDGSLAGQRPGQPVAVLSEILSRHERLMSGGRNGAGSVAGRTARGEGRYLPEAINVDMPLSDLVDSLSEIARGLKSRHDIEAGGGIYVPAGTNGACAGFEVLEAKLLFSGGPGTGKTAFAQWLSTALGLPLIQKRASELLSPFVGGTEQLIAGAFEEAEEAGAILLLDESDSLFIDRRYAERSWERSQTNELLTRMEAFSGILICCTNRREDFDSAAMRRFQWKVTFSPPRPEQLIELYRSYFMELCGEPDEALKHGLGRVEGLCPGDFATVYKALIPLFVARRGTMQNPALNDHPETVQISHEDVLCRLRTESGYRISSDRCRIGFAG